jgi:hypothetical protein
MTNSTAMTGGFHHPIRASLAEGDADTDSPSAESAAGRNAECRLTADDICWVEGPEPGKKSTAEFYTTSLLPPPIKSADCIAVFSRTTLRSGELDSRIAALIMLELPGGSAGLQPGESA